MQNKVCIGILQIQEEIATILKAVDSWLLFCRKAFNQGNKANPQSWRSSKSWPPSLKL